MVDKKHKLVSTFAQTLVALVTLNHSNRLWVKSVDYKSMKSTLSVTTEPVGGPRNVLFPIKDFRSCFAAGISASFPVWVYKFMASQPSRNILNSLIRSLPS